MLIRIKYIEHERIQDAPFVGALVSSIDCSINCKNCFNQELKTYTTITMDSEDIVKEIKNNIFNEGIILGGLEWTEQPKEMIGLIELALKNNLKIILYTGLSKNNVLIRFPELKNFNMYIKYGSYNEDLKNNKNIKYGVTLSTDNQNIIKIGDDLK